jgi:dihydroxy-acid dehydratase
MHAMLKANLPSRYLTEGAERACRCSFATADESTRCSADLKPAGRYVAKYVYESRDVPRLLRALLDYGDCLTGTGRAVAEKPQQVKWDTDQVVVQPAGKPLSATSGVVGLRGNLVPNGAPKVAGMADLQFAGSARFDGEEARFDQVKNKNYREGEVLVIRYGGLQGSPGMREVLPATTALDGQETPEKMCHAHI